MNIAFITTEYITEEGFDGGLANYLYRIVHLLIARGHYVEIFTLSNNDETISHEGVLVHRIKEVSVVLDLFNRILRYKFKRSLRFLSLSHSLYKRFRKRHNFNKFHIVQSSSCFASGLVFTFLSPVPVVTRVSSFEPMFRKYYKRKLNLDQRICEWLELYAMKRSNAVYAPSRFLAEMLKEEKISIDLLPPPFHLEITELDNRLFLSELAGKKYFLFFGAIGFLKGCEVLANSIPEILSKYPDIYFVFAGKSLEGPDGLTMIEYIYKKAGSNKERVIYLGTLFHARLYPIIQNAFAVVLPSLVDNLPNTMLEAMAFGKIVIGTQKTSLEEFIDHQLSGLLVEPGDAEQLTTAMKWVLNITDESKRAMEENALEKIKVLAPDRMCARLESYFQAVIRN